MAIEIERKFLLEELPRIPESSESTRIEQGYLAIDEQTEVRLRRADREGLLTVKGGHGEVRDEVEIHLPESHFDALWPLTEGRRLRKVRHLIPLEGGLEVELDVFEDELAGLLVAEVEFADEEQSHGFEPPEWLGEEITGDDRFAGQGLALNGAPSCSRDDSPRDRNRGYRLGRREAVADGVARIAAGRAEMAIEELAGSEHGDVAKPVHAARKDLKKLRSLLRMVRDGLGEERYRDENDRYREAGRRLSESRDAVVKLDTLTGLEDRFGGELPGASLEKWRRVLKRERAEVGEGSGLAVEVDRAIGEIEAGRDRIARWDLSVDSWELLASGLRRSYRRGRREMRRARDTRGGDEVHAWRKRVKDLWYQLRIVGSAWPELIGQTADQAHELADLLGDHHDLAVLAGDLGDRESIDDRGPILEAIERRQADLLDDALDLGARLYAEKPKAFLGRLGAYWQAWRPD